MASCGAWRGDGRAFEQVMQSILFLSHCLLLVNGTVQMVVYFTCGLLYNLHVSIVGKAVARTFVVAHNA